MTGLREGFRDVVAGWMLIDDIEALRAKIDLAAQWAAVHGPLNLAEAKTVTTMMASFFRKGIRAGVFTMTDLDSTLERFKP